MNFGSTASPKTLSQSSPSRVAKRRSVQGSSDGASLIPAATAAISSYYTSPAVEGNNGTPKASYTSAYVGGYYASGTVQELPSAPPLAATPLPYGRPASITRAPIPTVSATAKQQGPPQRPSYSHNTLTALLWSPCWCVVFLGQESVVPLQTFGALCLVVYGLDLANLREGVLYMTWFSTIVQTLVTAWFSLTKEENYSKVNMLNALIESVVTALFFTAAACWVTLQCQWLVKNNSNNLMPRQLEASLHAVLPPVFAALSTVSITRWIMGTSGSDTAATAAPHVFAIALVAAMLSVGAVESCFSPTGPAMTLATTGSNVKMTTISEPPWLEVSGATHDKPAAVVYALHKRVAWGHTALLLLVPGLMHVSMFRGRIFSRYAAADDLCDFLLAVMVPYLLFCIVQTFHRTNMRRSPYSGISSASLPSAALQNLIPLVVTVLVSFAVQQRYLIPICHKFSYLFMAVQSPTWLLMMYWTIATLSTIACFFFWDRISVSTGQLFFGEYHEDIVQLLLALSGLCQGKAIGLPWSMTPLPILGILGLSLWASTRMIRYLTIFLFVLHAMGVVVFTYRFIGIDQPMSLPLPGVDLTLIRFGMLVTFASILAGLVTGFAVRSSGGFMAPLLKKLDLVGFLLISYSFLLMLLEITLLKRPVPARELSGVEVGEDDIEDTLYDTVRTFLTTAILVGIALFMRRVRILHERSSSVVISLAVGKAVAVYLDAEETASGTPNVDSRGADVLYRALIAALLCAVVFAPRVFLEPVHIKTTVRHRSALNGGPDLPSGTMRVIGLYAFVFLPITIIATIPYVLFPLINAVAGSFRGESYYSVSPPISEYSGSAISLWGLALLSMLNHYLPDGGGEALKKMSALAFLMGIGIFFAAPTMGMGIGEAGYSPYASMSSLGSQLIMRGKSRTGGWGILSAALATLLAVSGPLELRERRHSSGRKDKHLLFRTMIFSLLFGGGVAWFITVQSMSESDWLSLILTLMATMTLSFLGTIAAVLGYFVEQDNLDEVEQIARTWFVGLGAFLPIAGIPQLVRFSSQHPFGDGGWLSTYLAVGCLSAFSFALSLNFRQGKDSGTRSLGNIGCLIAWLLAIIVLYGRYGVAGIDLNYEVTTIAGVPVSVLGTISLAPLLLALQGESSAQARGRRVSVTTSHKAAHSSTRLNLPQLSNSNRWFPLFFGTVSVFLCASLYAILLRGSGLFSLFGLSSAQSHEDIFAAMFDPSVRVAEGANDLAVLAEKARSHSLVLATSAQLAGSGFWTAGGLFGPLLHLAGVFTILPSLYFLVCQFWLGIAVASNQITLGLPLNAIPVLLCRGITSLRVAAVLTVFGAVAQLLLRRRSDQTSKLLI